MGNLLAFPARERNRSNEATKRLHFSLPHDEVGPLSIAIPADLAANVRRSALWAGKHPVQFVFDWLQAGFPPPEQPA
jgi:hypothetical protein